MSGGGHPRYWLILAHCFNMDGRAASQTITDKLPFIQAGGGLYRHPLSGGEAFLPIQSVGRKKTNPVRVGPHGQVNAAEKGLG